MNYESFSSLPPEEERQFVVFEQRTVESAKKANVIGIVVAGAFALLTLIIVMSYWGTLPKNKFGEEEPAAETGPVTK